MFEGGEAGWGVISMGSRLWPLGCGTSRLMWGSSAEQLGCGVITETSSPVPFFTCRGERNLFPTFEGLIGCSVPFWPFDSHRLEIFLGNSRVAQVV